MNDTRTLNILRCKIIMLALIILSIDSSSYSGNSESNSLLQRSNEDVNADKLMQSIVHHSIDIAFSSGSPDPDPYVKLGNDYAQLGQMQLALVNYEKALEVARRLYGDEDKRLANIYFNSAKAYDNKHMHKEAVVLYEKTIGLDSQFPNAKNLCAWILATSRDAAVRNDARALELAKLECGNSRWENPAHLDTYAAAQALSRNFSEATKWQRIAIELERGEFAVENYKQRLKFYYRNLPHKQPLVQPQAITVKQARYNREVEYFSKQYFVRIRDNPRNTIADSAHPDSMEAMKEGLYAVALKYAEDEDDGNQAKLKNLLEHLRLNAIADIKPLSNKQLFRKMNRIQVNRATRTLTVYRPFKLRNYVFYSQSDSWNGSYDGKIAIDKISITKHGEIAIAVIKHLTLYGGKKIEHYTTLFLKQREGSMKVLTVLTSSKYLPDVVTKQYKEARESIEQEKRKKPKIIPPPHDFNWQAYIQSRTSTVEKLGLNHHAAIRDLIEFYSNRDNHAKADALLNWYLELIEKKYGANHPEMTASLNSMADFYRNRKDYIKTETLLKQAVLSSEKPLDPTNTNVAYLLRKLEKNHYCYAPNGSREIRLKAVLAIAEKQLDPDHPRLADSLNDLAAYYGRQGDYAKAGPLYKRLLEFRKNVLGPDNLRTLASLRKLAEFYKQQDEHSKAEPLHERSLAISEKRHGPNHSIVVHRLHELADLYSEQKKHNKAEPLLKRALQISEKSMNPSYFNLTRSFSKLIGLYCEQKNYDKAEPLIIRSLMYEEKGSNPNLTKGSEVETEFTVLAENYSRQGDFAIAENLRKRTLAINEQVYGLNDRRVAYSLIDLAVTHLDQGEYLKAEPLLKRSLDLAKIALHGSPDHNLMDAILRKLTKIYRDTNRIPEAEKLERTLPEISKKWRFNRNRKRIRRFGLRAIQSARF